MSRESKPTRPMGLCSRASGTASAARNASLKASTVRTRKGGLAVRFSVAETMLTQVPSEPTSARATLKLFSGSEQIGRCIRRRGAGCEETSRGRGRRSGYGCARRSWLTRPPPRIKRQAVRWRGFDGHACAVIEDDVKRFHVINDFTAEQTVHTTTVVADHAAKGAAGVVANQERK